jgi:hypothetical protein
MILKTADVEPFNVPPVDNHQAALFTKQLNGTETFHYDGEITPLSMMLNSIKFNLPKHSFAHGYLLSVNIDTFMNACNSGLFSTMEPILKKICNRYDSD